METEDKNKGQLTFSHEGPDFLELLLGAQLDVDDRRVPLESEDGRRIGRRIGRRLAVERGRRAVPFGPGARADRLIVGHFHFADSFRICRRMTDETNENNS